MTATTTSSSADEAALRAAHAAASAPHLRAAPLRSNFAWTLAGNVVYAGTQWGILVALAKLATPEALGTFALAYALTAPVFLFAGLSLRVSQATDATRRFEFADYLGARALGMAAALAVTAGWVLVSPHEAQARLVILTVGVAKALEGLSDVHYGALQQHEQMRPIAVSLALRGVLSLGAVAAVLRAGGGLFPAVAALSLTWLAVLLAHDVPAVARLLGRGTRRSPRLSLAPLRRLAVTCLPLGAVQMLLSLQINVPRYVIERREGAAALGVFAALASLLTAGNVVVSALGQSATPRLARYFHERRLRAFRRLVAGLVLVGTALGVAGVAVALAAGGPILQLLFGARYAADAGLLVVLMVTGLALYVGSMLGYALTAARRFGVQVPIFGATAAVCAGACLALVPAHGLAGAAWGWTLSLLAAIAATLVALARALRRQAGGHAP